ncbi:MAG: hypothetical protein RI945_364 [Candidatus Parcubacteria bacterium]|jgi:hypothetical protein
MVNRQQRQKMEKHNEALPLSGNLFEKNKRRISLFKLTKMAFLSIFSLVIVFVVIYGFVISNKTSAESITQDTVLSELAKHIILPEEELVNLMRVQDAKNLVKQDVFYKNVKNGDYIIVYPSMVFVYNFDDNLIKNVKTY